MAKKITSISTSVFIGKILDVKGFVNVTENIIRRVQESVCKDRECRIGFRNGAIIEIDDMLVELRMRQGLGDNNVLECECIVKNEKQVPICMSIAFIVAEEVVKSLGKTFEGGEYRGDEW